MNKSSEPSNDKLFVTRALEATIHIGLVVLLLYCCFKIGQPFIEIILWGIIIAGVLLANAAGVIMEDVWSEKRIITIDLLGPEFIESVNTGDPIAIHSDGTLEIG